MEKDQTHTCAYGSKQNQHISHLENDITFRNATTADIPQLKDLFRDTVLAINIRNYTPEEVADWASCIDIPGRLAEQLANLYFIIAVDAEENILGFCSIRHDGYLHSIFVHKDHQRKGIATALLLHIENYAKKNSIHIITSEVSITALPFFKHHGYIIEQKQQVKANKLRMTNYRMKKYYKRKMISFCCSQLSSQVFSRLRNRLYEAAKQAF